MHTSRTIEQATRRWAAVIGTAVLLMGLSYARPAAAQERESMLPRVSPNATVTQTVGVTDITIAYGRPSVRGRTIFGELVPYDQVWRTGANEATTITFENDVQVEGEPLEAGTYSLFTIPRRSASWVLIFNEQANQWGAYNYDQEQDVLRVQVEPREAPPQELLTFSFEDVDETSATVVIRWADVAVPFDVQVNTEAAVRMNARAMIPQAEHWQMPYSFAMYALNSNVFLEDAIHWSTKAVIMNENYDTLALNARLYAQLGQYDEAVEAAEQAVRRAQAMEEEPEDLVELRSQLASWKSSS